METRLNFRGDVLAEFGADEAQAAELRAYNDNVFDLSSVRESVFPLPDELFVETWRSYAQEVAAAGSFAVLAKYLVQLRFPIAEGISQDPDYRAATTQGAGFGTDQVLRLPLAAPEKCHITLHATPAGHIPLLIAEERSDFIALVRALARRNEPAPIPDSMGACMVSGYNNWQRIFQDARQNGAGQPLDPAAYRDRFIILSKGYYSGVDPASMGLSDIEWRERSLVIRREHECTHYFTRRVFSSMRNNLLDELLADYCGTMAAAGRFRADWMLRFFGLENFPEYRHGARLENYRGKPPLSDGAFVVLQKLVKHAIGNLSTIHDSSTQPERRSHNFPLRELLALSTFTLEELASHRGPALIRDALQRLAASGPGFRWTTGKPSTHFDNVIGPDSLLHERTQQ